MRHIAGAMACQKFKLAFTGDLFMLIQFLILHNRLKADRIRPGCAFIWLEALLPSGLMSPVRIC